MPWRWSVEWCQCLRAFQEARISSFCTWERFSGWPPRPVSLRTSWRGPWKRQPARWNRARHRSFRGSRRAIQGQRFAVPASTLCIAPDSLNSNRARHAATSRNLGQVAKSISPLKKQPKFPIRVFQVQRSGNGSDRSRFSTELPIFLANVSSQEDKEIAIVPMDVPGEVEQGVPLRARCAKKFWV